MINHIPALSIGLTATITLVQNPIAASLTKSIDIYQDWQVFETVLGDKPTISSTPQPSPTVEYSLAYAIGGHSMAYSIAITTDGELLASTNDNIIKIWNLETGHLEKTLEGHSDSVLSLEISPDGRQLISSSSDGTIKIWNLRTGRL